MTTAQFGDKYYNYQYSPPVSPKSLPHGYKRKASSQEDEIETNIQFSNSFKKLRLSKSVVSDHKSSTSVLNPSQDNAKRSSPAEVPRPEALLRDRTPSDYSLNDTTHSSRHNSYAPANSQHNHDDDFMPVDDTADRVWVHDLDAEIAEIEAQEEKQRQEGIELSQAGEEYSKIPEHLLKRHSSHQDAASNMQMVLYRDPISISVPEEDDAVRRTIIEARRRMRQQQADDLEHDQVAVVPVSADGQLEVHNGSEDEDDMDID